MSVNPMSVEKEKGVRGKKSRAKGIKRTLVSIRGGKRKSRWAMDLDQEDAVVVWERWSSLWLKWNAAGQGQGGDSGEGGASAGSGLVGDRGGRKEGGSSGKEVVTRRTLSLFVSLFLSVSFCLTPAILSFFLLVLDFWLILRGREGGEGGCCYFSSLITYRYRQYDGEGTRPAKVRGEHTSPSLRSST